MCGCRSAPARDLTPGDTDSGDHQLFDLNADPAESTDLWSEHHAEHAQLTESLARWIRDLGESSRPEQATKFDAKQIKRLKALGYID